jgi:NADPH:quinone reductase-like Zn-dependent oxidoreductase
MSRSKLKARSERLQKGVELKALVYRRYGPPDVLNVEDVEKPVPKGDEVLVRVHAASINAADRVLLRGKPFIVRLGTGLSKPKHPILGFDVAGRVEAVGPRVEAVRTGDDVFGASRFGGFAEYACISERTLVSKPPNVSFEQAAATPTAAYTALQAIGKKGQLRPGERVLVEGASGGVGTFAVQLAKAFGAEVTAVCSTRNVEIARSIGADHVIDYSREDFTRSDRRYDLVLGVNAYRPISDYARALESNGTYVMSGGGGRQILQAIFQGLWLSKTGNKTLGNIMATAKKADLLVVKELLETGKIKPVIERTCSLSEVPDAIRRLESDHARGKTVITI